MLKNFLLVSLRNIVHNKGAAYLNILGMTLGMAACLFLFNYIQFHFTFDQSAKDHGIYRLETTSYTFNEPTLHNAYTESRAGMAALEHITEIKSITRLRPISEYNNTLFKNQKNDTLYYYFQIEKAYYADNNLLDFFDIQLTDGNRTSALRAPNSMLISASMANMIFPNEVMNGKSVLGRTFTSKASGILDDSFVITGVFADRPLKSHLKLDALLAWSSPTNGQSEQGGRQPENTYTYLTIPAGNDLHKIEKKATSILYPKVKIDNDAVVEPEDKRVSVRPIKDIHLARDVSNEPENGVSASLLIFLTAIGIIIIVLACTNYINNAIINSIERAKEVGIRKLLGITPWQLGMTLIGEALFANALAIVFAVLFFLFGRRMMEVYTDFSNPTIDASNITVYLIFILLMLLFSTLFSSIYPAIYLSSLNPISALRGKSSVLQSGYFTTGSNVIRLLLIFQLSTSIVFLSAVYIVYRQLQYLEQQGRQPMDLSLTGVFPGEAGANDYYVQDITRFLEGPGRKDLLNVKITNLYQNRIKVKQEISSLQPIKVDKDGRKVILSDDTVRHRYKFQVIDHQYWRDSSEVFLAGNNFRQFTGLDFNSLIVNESALAAMQIQSPDSAIGQMVDSKGGYLVITGVVKNQFSNAPPSVYATGYRYLTYFDINLHYPGTAGTSLHDFIKRTEFLWGTYFKQFTFLDNAYDDQKVVERNILKIFLFFSALAITIASMGMFGLASYVTQKRSKEIGIRKVLGASTQSILRQLLSDFLRLVLIGCFFAVPIIWLGAQEWLNTYPRKMPLEPSLVLFPILCILFISALVIGEKCWRTAIKSPLETLQMD